MLKLLKLLKLLFFKTPQIRKIPDDIDFLPIESIKTNDNYDTIPTIDYKNPPCTKTILIVDDNEYATKVTKKEIEGMILLSDKLNAGDFNLLDKNDRTFISTLSNEELVSLNMMHKQKYNIIVVHGELAGFTAIDAINNGLFIDYAFLDIIIGGRNIYLGKSIVLDGIDIASHLAIFCKECKYIFYSGCTITHESIEYIKANDVLGIDINDCIVHKDNNFNKKKKKILGMLV
jgi:hypothetical protein